jgi:Bifunctional DNA primase/polymerase, N-terminal
MDPTALRHQLVAAGYCPLPLRGKAPFLKNWQQRTEPSRKDIEYWAQHFSDATNTGLLTRLMPTLDIDITDPAAVEAIESFVRGKFERRGYILSRTGKRPKTAIPFRTNEPFRKLSRSMIAPDGSTGQKIELLCDGQQIVVDGIHPETRRPYRWYGGAPGAIKFDELPKLHPDEAQALVDDVVELLCRDFGYKRPPEHPRKANGGDDLSGAADWGHLVDNIRCGRKLHDSLRDLAAKLIAAGMSVGAAINFLRGLMEKSDIPHDARWQERYDDIPRAVETAAGKQDKPAPAVEPRRLDEVHEIFRRWLGADYDFDTLDATLAVAASERLPGDPVWLMVVSGAGNAKTETVQATGGLGAHVVSTISSDGALLSATPQKQRSKSATGGLLRKIGDHGILVIKDFTSILSADRNVRGTVLAALREIHDGRWVRNVGSDGGRTLQWEGRVIVIGACTTAWDQAHSVISTMGDRFVLIRSDSHQGRIASGLRAVRNTGSETQMRKEMADAVAGVVANIDTTKVHALSEDDQNVLVKAANLVTLARTGVERDYKGDVINAHAPEMPTRFAKQLTQIMLGGVAIGMDSLQARRLAIRCARDSMPDRLGTERRIALFASAASRLLRAYAMQMEVFRRLRNGGQQFCRVEHVHVNDGGQAIIGNVKKADR